MESTIIAGEFYSTFDKDKADALMGRLQDIGLEAATTIEINNEEKMILFEVLRASTQLHCPGCTLLYEDFTRKLLSETLKWGDSTFKLIS